MTRNIDPARDTGRRRTRGPGSFAACLVLFALTALAALPLSLEAQAAVGASVVAAMVVMAVAGVSGPWRLALALLGIFLVFRYIVWRSLETIPFGADPWTLTVGLMLYSAEIYAVIVLLVGVFSVARPIRWPAAALPADERTYPTVDVFVPSYNESPELLASTLSACRRMRYPATKFQVYLLDDGGTDQKCHDADPVKASEARARRAELQELCQTLGCVYMTRARNERAKAGNLNAAFARTDGELVAVFDADHVPAPAFLERTVGHFLTDAALFLVQTPHFFLNADPHQRNTSGAGPQSEHEMFYHTVQPGLDNWNATFFCGSAAVLRRAPLAEVGGFSGESVTEDCETALKLHAAGYTSRYIDTPLIAGLQPDTLKDFVTQRTRWAQGMMQIFLFSNPLLKRGLSAAQRVCYTASMVFWLFPFARLTMVLAPLVFLLFGLQIYEARVDEFMVYTVPALGAVLLLSHALYGRTRPPFVSELYEFIQCAFLSRALLRVLINPRKPSFAVTPKQGAQGELHLSPAAGPLILLVGLMTVGLAAAGYRLTTQPELRDIFLIVSCWNAVNLVIGLAALGVVLERPQRRDMPRAEMRRAAHVAVDGQALPAVITDASVSGARLRVGEALARAGLSPGDLIWLEPETVRADTPEGGLWFEIVGIRRTAGGIDVRGTFAPRDAWEHAAVVDLVYGDHAPWAGAVAGRHRPVNYLAGLGRFVRLAAGAGLAFAGFALSRGLSDRPTEPVDIDQVDPIHVFHQR
jgi:cellulose synthase (UDP-forming)